jgi:tRNA splicing endonuclease
MKREELLAKLAIKQLEQKRKEPFNSAQMVQEPFEFFEDESWEDRHSSDEDKAREAFAKKYFEQTCGSLYLNWDIDAYWTLVVKKIMIPHVVAIHQALVDKGHDEENSLMYGDADGDVFWLPAANPNTKVIIHTNQCRDYMYVYTQMPTARYDRERHHFHVRRIWRSYESTQGKWRVEDIQELYAKVLGKDFEHIDMILNEKRTHQAHDNYVNELRELVAGKLTKTQLNNVLLRGQKEGGMSPDDFVKTVLDRVESHEELADDHSQYPQRPSLEYYRARGFNMGQDRDYSKGYQHNGIYGDLRDPGYVISLGEYGSHDLRTASNMSELEHISTIYLPCIARDLDLEIDSGWSHQNGR